MSSNDTKRLASSNTYEALAQRQSNTAHMPSLASTAQSAIDCAKRSPPLVSVVSTWCRRSIAHTNLLGKCSAHLHFCPSLLASSSLAADLPPPTLSCFKLLLRLPTALYRRRSHCLFCRRLCLGSHSFSPLSFLFLFWKRPVVILAVACNQNEYPASPPSSWNQYPTTLALDRCS